MDMVIRELAKEFMENNYPSEVRYDLRCSRYYPNPKDHWWLTLSVKKCFEESKQGTLNILLQKKDNKKDFYFLKVPFSFFNKHK